MVNRWTALIAVAIATAVATVVVWAMTVEAGKGQAEASLGDELRVLGRTVESEVDRFRYLPAVVGREGRIRAALATGTPEQIEAADRYLARVRADSRAAELYIMTPQGMTIAASNHDEPTSFVGNNYRFRPYFQNAVARGEGRYYAVGVTTGKPGYFLASAIRDEGRLLGVAVVKVDMLDIGDSWRKTSTIAALVDSNGIVFLTSHAPWQYRPLHRLNDAVLADIAQTRKYDGVDITSASPIFSSQSDLPAQTAIDGAGPNYLLQSIDIEPDGWRLIGARSLGPIYANAHLMAVLTVLVGMLICGAGIYLRQRRQFVRAKLEEHDRLERRVAERTSELNREIEDRRRAEENLREAQATLIQTAKLAALGRMSTAIVHEVSQPLSALENTLATAGVLADRGEAAAVKDKMRAAREMVRRIQRTVKLLRSFARKQPGTREPVAIGRSIAAAVELAEHRARSAGVRIVIADAAPLTVMANAVRLEQVILNLLVNALDAVEGQIEPTIRISSTCKNGAVEISVADDGPGIAPELRGRIAEPFFTTKQTGEGLGLGLSISRAIIGEFGGSLTFASEEGVGSIFTISLPRALDIQEAAE